MKTTSIILFYRGICYWEPVAEWKGEFIEHWKDDFLLKDYPGGFNDAYTFSSNDIVEPKRGGLLLSDFLQFTIDD